MASTAVYPPLSPEELEKEVQATLTRELAWLLASLQDTFASLRNGLQECNAILEPVEPGSTLVVSSSRSESVKGIVNRVGTRIVKADISLRFQTLPPPPQQSSPSFRVQPGSYPIRLSTQPPSPILNIPQLSTTRNLLANSLDVVDASTYTGDSGSAPFIAGQLRLLLDLVQETRATLKGGEDVVRPWHEDPMDENAFDPPLPPSLALTINVVDAALVLQFRTLSILQSSSSSTPPVHQAAHNHAGGSSTSSGAGASSFPSALASFSPFHASPSDPTLSLRQRLGLAARLPEHDESGTVFSFRGQEVKVREKARVESQDPSLMAVMAKLSALEHGIKFARKGLAIVMGADENES